MRAAKLESSFGGKEKKYQKREREKHTTSLSPPVHCVAQMFEHVSAVRSQQSAGLGVLRIYSSAYKNFFQNKVMTSTSALEAQIAERWKPVEDLLAKNLITDDEFMSLRLKIIAEELEKDQQAKHAKNKNVEDFTEDELKRQPEDSGIHMTAIFFSILFNIDIPIDQTLGQRLRSYLVSVQRKGSAREEFNRRITDILTTSYCEGGSPTEGKRKRGRPPNQRQPVNTPMPQETRHENPDVQTTFSASTNELSVENKVRQMLDKASSLVLERLHAQLLLGSSVLHMSLSLVYGATKLIRRRLSTLSRNPSLLHAPVQLPPTSFAQLERWRSTMTGGLTPYRRMRVVRDGEAQQWSFGAALKWHICYLLEARTVLNVLEAASWIQDGSLLLHSHIENTSALGTFKRDRGVFLLRNQAVVDLNR
eukprot:gene12539-8591_t